MSEIEPITEEAPIIEKRKPGRKPGRKRKAGRRPGRPPGRPRAVAVAAEPQVAKSKYPPFDESKRYLYGGDMAGIATGPLRKPNENAVRPGTHTITDLGWRGSIIYLPNPAKEWAYYWPYIDLMSEEAAVQLIDAQAKGWRFVPAEEVSLHPDLREVIKANSSGLISVLGKDDKAQCLTRMEWERYVEMRKREQKARPDINQSAEEKLRQQQEEANRAAGSGPYRYETAKLEVSETKEQVFIPDPQ